MGKFSSHSDYQHDITPGTGLLITNLGTPDAASVSAVRRYLREFLSDQRVVEIPRPLWWLLLNTIILPFRAPQSAKMYQKIWSTSGSPLRHYTLSIRDQLAALCPDVHIEVAMRYGNPSIRAGLEKLREKQIKKLIVLPLYPQYSGTTTASTFDAVSQQLQQWRWVPELRFINTYHDQPKYIDAVASSIKNYFKDKSSPDKYVFSFHGIPEAFVKQGDPYQCYCFKTGRLIAEKLDLSQDQWQITFQSRFGKAKWLTPYTDVTLQELGNSTQSVAVICPGFAVDCLETLEEINILNRDIYLQHGGKEFHYIPALNDSVEQIHLLKEILEHP